MAASPDPGSGTRRLISSSALLVLGGAAGVVLGSLLETPRLLLRAWLEPVERIELVEASERVPPGPAAEIALLQEPDPAPVSAPHPSRKPTLRAPAPPRTTEAPTAEELVDQLRKSRKLQPVPAAPSPDPEPESVPADAAPVPPPNPEPAAPLAPPAALPGAPVRGPVVQVAAHVQLAPAERLVERMRAQGFDAYLSGTQPAGPRRFRVRVVPGDSEDIEGLVRRLRAQGYDTWTTRE